MTRSVPEWIGANDDQRPPPRVLVRIFDRYDGRCAICKRQIRGSLRPEYDHSTALINEGENREGNYQLLCHECHAVKTKSDVAEKAEVYRKRVKHLGLKKSKGPSIPGSKSSPFKKKLNGTVERRS